MFFNRVINITNSNPLSSLRVTEPHNSQYYSSDVLDSRFLSDTDLSEVCPPLQTRLKLSFSRGPSSFLKNSSPVRVRVGPLDTVWSFDLIVFYPNQYLLPLFGSFPEVTISKGSFTFFLCVCTVPLGCESHQVTSGPHPWGLLNSTRSRTLRTTSPCVGTTAGSRRRHLSSPLSWTGRTEQQPLPFLRLRLFRASDLVSVKSLY